MCGYIYIYIFFFQGDQNTKQKKKPTQLSQMHSRAIQCKQAACTSILTEEGNGRPIDVRVRSPAPHVENTANAWLPIQTYGITSKGRNFNCRV